MIDVKLIDANRDIVISMFVFYTILATSAYLYGKGYRKWLYILSCLLILVGSILFAIQYTLTGNKLTTAGFAIFLVILFGELLMVIRRA